ncbi:phosphotransferase [Deinococcus sp.]|uniref:phosphotransferase n=1 Tax=Deinococcus sp. TaxID=47478 RepID=UPI003CC6041D
MTSLSDFLLTQAMRHFSAADWSAASVQALPIESGVSGVKVRRYELTHPDGPCARVVVKPCGLKERLTLARLDGGEGVPGAYVPDLHSDEEADVVMEDAGETLLGWTLADREAAARALSAVHAHFMGRRAELAWLPDLDAAYLEGFIVERCWRGTWQRARGNPDFVREFGGWISVVEASVQTLAADLLAFVAQTDVQTLAHTDVYYGHIFRQGERAVVIDWGQARYAPLFLDIGDTFDTAEGAQVYRTALAARGVRLSDSVFETGHRLARRFAGVRYVWWWLESWQRDPQDWNREGLERMLGMAAGQPG